MIKIDQKIFQIFLNRNWWGTIRLDGMTSYDYHYYLLGSLGTILNNSVIIDDNNGNCVMSCKPKAPLGIFKHHYCLYLFLVFIHIHSCFQFVSIKSVKYKTLS